mmetsp:Transcript_18166/g.49087  ORF Transcript_18166/g.49087 Transcript_18166/m.49087 type:complete len:312 (-) Transcript_18166:7-942(-)
MAPLVDHAARRVRKLLRLPLGPLKEVRVEAGRPANDAVLAHRRARVHARLRRLERDHLAVGLLALEELPHARHAAARADAVHEHVDLPFGLRVDLRPSVRNVCGRVVHVLHLVDVPIVGARAELVDVCKPAGRAGGGVEQMDVGAKLAADHVSLVHGRHLRHADDALVALCSGDERFTDARVARREVHQRRHARLDLALLLCRLDHVERNPILERAARVLHLELDEHARRLGVDGEALLEGDHRRLADGAQVVDDGRRRHLARLARQDLRHARHRIGSLLAHDLADGRRDLLLEVLLLEVIARLVECGRHA